MMTKNIASWNNLALNISILDQGTYNQILLKPNLFKRAFFLAPIFLPEQLTIVRIGKGVKLQTEKSIYVLSLRKSL